MGGTGRSKRRKREEEHGTGLEHLGIDRLTEGTGQRDRIRRRRLAYKLEKKGEKLTENVELVALVERQKRQRKLRIQRERQNKRLQKHLKKSSYDDDDGDDGDGSEIDDDSGDDKENETEVIGGKDSGGKQKCALNDDNDNDDNDDDDDDDNGEHEEDEMEVEVNGNDNDNDDDDDDDDEEEDEDGDESSVKPNGKEINTNGTSVGADDDDDDDDDDDNDEDDDEDESEDEDEGKVGVRVNAKEVVEEGSDDDDEGDDNATNDNDDDGNGDDDDDDDDDEDEDEDEDDIFGSDSELPPDKLEIASAKLLKEQGEEEADAAAEQADDRVRAEAEVSEFKLDTGLIGRGGGDSGDVPATREELMQTIRGILYVLSDFKTRCEEDKSRADYLEAFRAAVCECFNYHEELCDMLMEVFPNGEVVDFMEASEGVRPLTIRTNTLKVRRRELAQALMSRGMNVDPIDKWSKVGLVVYDSQVPVGATPEYLAGQYMIQSASSFLPVVALAPREGEQVIDLAAAPGGKSSYIGAVLKGSGVLVANDVKRERIKSLVANIHRLGICNAVVTNYDGRQLPSVFGACFDRALLDAPCSGTGIISHDPNVKTNRSKDDVANTVRLQKELLLAAIDSVNHKSATGGYVVYSTCSVLVQENEEVVAHALRKRHVKIVDSGIAFGVAGFTNMKGTHFHPDMALAKRIYPHVHNLDGFFVCKLKKLSNRRPEAEKRRAAAAQDDDDDDDGKSKKDEESKKNTDKDDKSTKQDGDAKVDGAKKNNKQKKKKKQTPGVNKKSAPVKTIKKGHSKKNMRIKKTKSKP